MFTTPFGSYESEGSRIACEVDGFTVTATIYHDGAWCNDEWSYVGVAITVEKDGVRLTGKYDHACWGIESNAGKHITEIANELLDEAVEAARDKLYAPRPASLLRQRTPSPG